MALLGSGTLANSGTSFYVRAGAPALAPVIAPSFEAIGTGSPANGGSFTANNQDLTGQGADSLVIAAGGVARWGLGVQGVEPVPPAGNAGSDLFLAAYNDDGTFLADYLTIDRATGSMGFLGDNTTSVGQFAAGTPATVGGGLIYANGPSGVSRVFDGVYNPPAPGPEVLLSQYGPTGAPAGPLVPYTPAKTGLYTLTMEVRMDPAGFSWTNGVSLIVGVLANQAPPFQLISDAFLACDSMANPGAGFNIPSGFVAGAYAKDIVAVINLTAGTTYVPTISIDSVNPFNLGTTGGVRFFIQPVIA
jgi:hypothetical protein